MRLALLALLAVAAPLAAQTPPGTVLTPEPSPGVRTPEALARLPTERYGVEWGMTRADVVATVGRPPDADEPQGITYVGRRSAGQVVYIFQADATGTDRLTAVVEASPAMVHLRDALAEMDQYKAALIRRWGAPRVEDSPRPGTSPPVTDSVWEAEGDVRAVELTLDYAVSESGTASPFFYIRTVGPEPTP